MTFLELRQGEGRRISLPFPRVNSVGRSEDVKAEEIA